MKWASRTNVVTPFRSQALAEFSRAFRSTRVQQVICPTATHIHVQKLQPCLVNYMQAPQSRRSMTTPTFMYSTARLLVRRTEATDVDAMHAVYGDADAMRWVGDGVPLAREQCKEWLAITQRNYALRGYGMSALAERHTGEVVGFCGLVHPGGQPEVEIKYALRREFWGKGLATEAAAGMLAYGASAFDIAHVIATTAPANVASHRVLGKAGMRRGALRRNEDGSFTQLFEWQRSACEIAP